MGMAHQAPEATYTRALGITDHAIERLRQRLDKNAMANTTHRNDDDLGNLIDEAAMDAFHRNDYEEEMDRGTPIKIARLEHLPSIEPLYAIVKPNDEPARHKGMPFVVVTLYTKRMIDDARARGRWTWAKGDLTSTHVRQPGKLDSKKTTQLIQKLTGFGSKLQVALELADMKGQPIVPTTPKAQPDVAHVPLPVRSVLPPPAPTALPVANATEVRLVTYHHFDIGKRQFVEYQAGELKQRLAELHSDETIDHTTIKVWREVKTKARVTVEYDIEE